MEFNEKIVLLFEAHKLETSLNELDDKTIESFCKKTLLLNNESIADIGCQIDYATLLQETDLAVERERKIRKKVFLRQLYIGSGLLAIEFISSCALCAFEDDMCKPASFFTASTAISLATALFAGFYPRSISEKIRHSFRSLQEAYNKLPKQSLNIQS